MLRLLPISLLIFGLSSFVLASESAVDYFRNIDVFELEVVTDPQISPAGNQIVYVRRSSDIMTDRARSNIWIVDTDGENHRPLLSGVQSYTSPRWSPTGDRMAYISNSEGGGWELYVRWMDTGQTALLSNLAETPSGLVWSPDGTMLAFSALVKSESESLATAPTKPEGAQWAPPAILIENLNYRVDGKGYLTPGYDHIFVIPADAGSPRQITTGDFNHRGTVAWAPDGESIVLSSNRNSDWRLKGQNRDLWSVSVLNGGMSQLTFRDGPEHSPSFSPDGVKLVFLGYEDKKMGYHNSVVSLMDLADGSIENLTPNLDRSVNSVRWT
ncbi:MAG: Tol biopolymer transport system component, partial [Pseudohongiellaceae bacterium]